jgi:hypothetical protein
VFTGDSAEVQSTIVVGLRKQSKSRCINRLKRHPSHSAPNRRLPGYPAGETLILGGGFRNRRRCELQQRVLRCSQLLRSDLRPPQLQFRRFANFTDPVLARCCSRVLLELQVLSCAGFTPFAVSLPAIGQQNPSVRVSSLTLACRIPHLVLRTEPLAKFCATNPSVNSHWSYLLIIYRSGSFPRRISKLR